MKKVATTVKIESSLYDEFKVLGIHCRVSLQSLVEKCVYRFVKEEPFRNDINNFNIPIPSDTPITETIVTASFFLTEVPIEIPTEITSSAV